MHTYPYGAHEVMELHEVLNTSIDALNTLQLYQPYARDPELSQMLHHQLAFMQTEYNHMVHVVKGIGVAGAVPYRPQVQVNQQAGYPANQPVQPNLSPAQMDDRDVASAMLGLHKAGANLKFSASLESAHPQIRQMLQQGAISCANQAYEVWGYLQRKGHYPLVALQEATNAQLLRGYQPVTTEQGHVTHAAQPSVPTSGSALGATLSNTVEPSAVSSQQQGMPLTSPIASPSPQPTGNAGYLFSSPAYRDEHDVAEVEQMSMGIDWGQSQAVDPLASLTQQADVRQKRAGTRKKAGSADPGHSV
jgi:spore coat protein CotF